MKKILTLFSLVFAVTSCSGIYDVKPPEIALNNLLISKVTLFETSALAKIRIENENDWDLQSSGGVYRLHVNGNYLGKALDKEGFLVERFSSKVKELELTIDNLSLLKQVNSLMQRSSVNYKLEAKVFVTSPIRRTLSVTKDGDVSLLNSL